MVKQTTEQATRHTRVILGACCYADAEASLDLATELARLLGADLHGMMVRDDVVFGASAVSQVSVISFSGKRASGISMDRMRVAFAADARQFEQQLNRRARAAALQCYFRKTQGNLAETLQKSAGAGDIVVFAFKPVLRVSGALVLILGQQGAIPDYIAKLARKLRKPLVVLTSALPQKPDSRVLLPPGQQVVFQAYENADAMLAVLERMSPTAVFLSPHGHDLPSISRIVESARSPVILYNRQE